jgi:pilus assembly protein FimV
MLQRQLFRLSCAIVLSGMLSCAQAVELGEPLVRSHVGQPLSADIELTSVASEAASVQAALADPEVYRGASISMHPALAALNITIVRRDGKRFLHLASPKAIDAEYVHLFFSLTENGLSTVRGTTLWFTPDPNPAPPPPPAMPMPAPAAVTTTPVAVAAPIAAVPRPPVAAAIAAPALRPVRAAQPVACAPQFSAGRIAACTALDSKNAALSARIVELEDKVKVLTVAMQAAVEPAPVRPAIKPVALKAAPAKPAAAPSAKPAGSTPWLFIGIAGALIAALVGVLVYILLRKRRGKGKGEGTATRAAGLKARALIVSVRDRLLPAKKAPPEAELAAE